MLRVSLWPQAVPCRALMLCILSVTLVPTKMQPPWDLSPFDFGNLKWLCVYLYN